MNKAWLMSAREDMLQLKLYSAISSVEDGLGRIRQLVKCLQARDDGLSPATFDGKPVSLPAIEMELSKAGTQPHTILTLSRDSCPWADYALGLFSRTMHLSIEIQIQFSYFSEPGLEINRAESVLAFVREISSFLQPVYGYCHSSADIDLGKKVAPLAVLSETVIEEMYWLNYFGPKRAAEISHERLLRAPGCAIEKLSSGGWLVLTQPTPVNFASDAARIAQASALAHLRPDCRLEDVLAELRERSRILAPVERDWHPDVAPVLELLLDNVLFARRQQTTVTFNQFVPPPVSECQRVESCPPSDVASIEQAVRRYGFEAEKLIAMVHDRVPQTLSKSIESLPGLDAHFYRLNEPRRLSRQQIDNELIPMVGSYLGSLFVKHLRGKWVPRQSLDESYVVAADYACFPFRRAKHYFQSKQSVLDYSLTQCYREMERAVRSAAVVPDAERCRLFRQKRVH